MSGLGAGLRWILGRLSLKNMQQVSPLAGNGRTLEDVFQKMDM